MIVGYSFRDPHINEILAACVKTGLKLFIIDLAGIGVLDYAPKVSGIPLLDELRDAIEGGSRRPFPSSVSTDEIERRKIQRFFPLFP